LLAKVLNQVAHVSIFTKAFIHAGFRKVAQRAQESRQLEQVAHPPYTHEQLEQLTYKPCI
jgi:hypothetical protein